MFCKRYDTHNDGGDGGFVVVVCVCFYSIVYFWFFNIGQGFL